MALDAATANGTASVAHAAEVANHFVKVYYEQLSKNPEGAYRFYKDSGSLIYDSPATLYADPNQPTQYAPVAAEGKAAMQDFFTKHAEYFKGADIQRDSVSSDISQEGAVVVMVIGKIRTKADPYRAMRFVQTFYLQLQKPPHNFALRNDILRYIGYAQTPVLARPVEQEMEMAGLESENQKLKIEVEQLQRQMQVFEAAHTEPAPSIFQAPALQDPLGWESTPPSAEVNDWQAKPEPVVAPVVAQESFADKMLAEDPGDSKPAVVNAWSDLFNKAPSEAPSSANAAGNTTTTTSNSNKRISQVPKGEKGRNGQHAVNLTIHVKGISPQMQKKDLQILFQNTYGEVKDVDIYTEKGYGFVYFKSTESVAAALEAGTLSTDFGDLSLGAKREKGGKGNDNKGKGGRAKGRGGGRTNSKGKGGNFGKGGRGRNRQEKN